MIRSIRTVEAVYEKGFLRPLEPIDARDGLHFLVTIFEMKAEEEQRQSPGSLRGKYRGYLSTTNEFIARKQKEKALEL